MISKQRIVTVIAAFTVPLVFLMGYEVGQSPKQTVTNKPPVTVKSPIVGIFIESVARQINIKDLQARYPGETAQLINPAALKADAIVGWYDKGNNFHEQKMENNISKIMGGELLVANVLRGTALRGVQTVSH